jgi:hypothetical protein
MAALTAAEKTAPVRSCVKENLPAMELCQNCYFYGQCNNNPSRLHLEDSGFETAAKAFEKTFAETKVCLKGSLSRTNASSDRPATAYTQGMCA